MQASERLTYEQFGRAFIGLVITPDEIAQSINAQLGADISIAESVAAASVTGTATPASCSATRAPAGDDGSDTILVTVPLHISLHVSILELLDEDYDVSANVALRLRVQTWSPLTIIIAPDTVAPDDVTLQISTSSWLKIAERLGGLEQQIKAALCSNFNDRISQGQSSRQFDVLERVRASLKASQG
jgi:hypothetical protein